jgi:hypothetical protein
MIWKSFSTSVCEVLAESVENKLIMSLNNCVKVELSKFKGAQYYLLNCE